MAIPVVCSCGRRFDPGSEFGDRQVGCPACGSTLDVPSIRPQADAVLESDKFLLKQKRIAINEKYTVHDEQNRPIVFVERPTYLFRSIIGAFGVVFVVLCGVVGALLATAAVDAALPGSGVLPVVAFIGVMAVTLMATLFAAVNFFPKRHLSFFLDPDRKGLLFRVRQDSKWQMISATYSLLDPDGLLLAGFSKNTFTNIIRKRWRCTKPDGEPLCSAYEDSIILALARRFLGPMMGLLRTNFVIVEGNGSDGRVLGEFNRKFTLFDRYVLDLSADAARSLDRRVALALGVLLDSGERR